MVVTKFLSRQLELQVRLLGVGQIEHGTKMYRAFPTCSSDASY
jgi:hypothetical protein